MNPNIFCPGGLSEAKRPLSRVPSLKIMNLNLKGTRLKIENVRWEKNHAFSLYAGTLCYLLSHLFKQIFDVNYLLIVGGSRDSIWIVHQLWQVLYDLQWHRLSGHWFWPCNPPSNRPGGRLYWLHSLFLCLSYSWCYQNGRPYHSLCA